MPRLGINGLGRIGRLALRAAFDAEYGDRAFDIALVNEVKGGVETAAHLLEFDSVHGRWRVPIAAENGGLRVDGASIAYSEAAKPGDIPWDDHGVDIVLECSGKFRSPQTLQGHFDRGAKTVIVAAPVKEGALNLVVGVNDDLYRPGEHRLITAASCTTNCLAPVVKVIHEGLGIERGVITTVHDVTNTQVLVDAPHKDLRRARSALTSLIPTSTGSATAITMIYPELKGKLNGIAVRVPLLNASLTDCVFQVQRDTTVEEVNALLRNAAEGPLKGILGFEARPLVSVDFVNDTRSSIIDGPSTMVVDNRLLKILAWYDNEMGYAYRMIDLANTAARGLRL
ncbi:ArsJ-associated glyceraldehyde-3-phosphate dehydrogenase [Inquilinus sp. OTU3971]|uniref:ArsJ-associated glyceraldehyde-3-phosphate dehydrogenase n=1 Tax=Inquilinus sp. OTU3971 TaxID=3043855 RepID=UPI00313C59F5